MALRARAREQSFFRQNPAVAVTPGCSLRLRLGGCGDIAGSQNGRDVCQQSTLICSHRISSRCRHRRYLDDVHPTSSPIRNATWTALLPDRDRLPCGVRRRNTPISLQCTGTTPSSPRNSRSRVSAGFRNLWRDRRRCSRLRGSRLDLHGEARGSRGRRRTEPRPRFSSLATRRHPGLAANEPQA